MVGTIQKSSFWLLWSSSHGDVDINDDDDDDMTRRSSGELSCMAK